MGCFFHYESSINREGFYRCFSTFPLNHKKLWECVPLIYHANFIKCPVFFLVFCLVLIGCSSSVRFSSDKSQYKNNNSTIESSELTPIRSNIITEAQKWLGTPYCLGGSSTKCTDCSGFVFEIFSKFGYKLPRTAAEQYIYSYKIADGTAEAGDLIFFSNGSKISHVGIYAGNNYMIHASASSGVVLQSLDASYLNMRVAGYGRVVN